MIGLPAGARIWLAAGVTDMRAGFNGLAAKVQTALRKIRSVVTSSCSVATRRHDQIAAVDRPWPLFTGQVARARLLHLPTSHQRHGLADAGATIDAARRDRLAAARAYLEEDVGLINVPGLA
jgi:transposase